MAITSGESDERPHQHLQQTTATWHQLQDYLKQHRIDIDGRTLNIAGVVAVARFDCLPHIDKTPDLLAGINGSLDTLNTYLADGSYLYGVNTGFGGSADVRTKDMLGLQVALMQHTQSAVIIETDKAATVHDELKRHTMPSTWVKGTMLVRANANIRGHSAMKLSVAEAILELLQNDCSPLVPLRGSISASGDLMPLSYVAGSIMGNPDIRVQVGKGQSKSIIAADRALELFGMQPTMLGPKEGLSLINGTAPSAAVAALALYEANNLAVITQLLTAMSAEGLAANVEWAHPFISDVRPHDGQIEAAYNIRKFLSTSRLVVGLSSAKDRFKLGLAQERYALRSSPQWLSPILEDLLLAQRQITTELNSTSDNPVVNVPENDVHCGANFQAAAVTSASEKVRFCLQMLGKLIFSQTTELINNALNNGLPPNLAADDPSLSFCLKGIDVNMAAYQSELAYLANPVSSHVQSAEMHNQSVNSLALLTTRYTMESVEVVSLMCAASLYTVCQALDLRVMHITFLEKFKPMLSGILKTHFQVADNELATSLERSVWTDICTNWYETACHDAHERTAKAAAATIATIADFIAEVETLSDQATSHMYRNLKVCKDNINTAMLQEYVSHRDAFFKHQTTSNFLGHGTKHCYNFIRNDLGVPFHRGLVEQPGPFDKTDNKIDGRDKKIIGSWVSIIYEAVRDGRLIEQVMLVGSPDVAVNGNNPNGANGTNSTNGTNGASVTNGSAVPERNALNINNK